MAVDYFILLSKQLSLRLSRHPRLCHVTGYPACQHTTSPRMALWLRTRSMSHYCLIKTFQVCSHVLCLPFINIYVSVSSSLICVSCVIYVSSSLISAFSVYPYLLHFFNSLSCIHHFLIFLSCCSSSDNFV